MKCCSRKTLFVLLGIAGLLGLLIATKKVNTYAILPFLPLLACPLMCVIMMTGHGREDNKCHTAKTGKRP